MEPGGVPGICDQREGDLRKAVGLIFRDTALIRHIGWEIDHTRTVTRRLILCGAHFTPADDERKERVKPFAKRKLIDVRPSAFLSINCPISNHAALSSILHSKRDTQNLSTSHPAAILFFQQFNTLLCERDQCRIRRPRRDH
jgi:hypothetical protein